MDSGTFISSALHVGSGFLDSLAPSEVFFLVVHGPELVQNLLVLLGVQPFVEFEVLADEAVGVLRDDAYLPGRVASLFQDHHPGKVLDVPADGLRAVPGPPLDVHEVVASGVQLNYLRLVGDAGPDVHPRSPGRDYHTVLLDPLYPPSYGPRALHEQDGEVSLGEKSSLVEGFVGEPDYPLPRELRDVPRGGRDVLPGYEGEPDRVGLDLLCLYPRRDILRYCAVDQLAIRTIGPEVEVEVAEEEVHEAPADCPREAVVLDKLVVELLLNRALGQTPEVPRDELTLHIHNQDALPIGIPGYEHFGH